MRGSAGGELGKGWGGGGGLGWKRGGGGGGSLELSQKRWAKKLARCTKWASMQQLLVSIGFAARPAETLAVLVFAGRDQIRINCAVYGCPNGGAVAFGIESGGGERERERGRDRHRQTDRQTDRDRERQRQTDRQTDRQMSSQ